MKFKTSFITIAGCAAMLGSSFVYAEDARWSGKQSYGSAHSAVGAPMGAGQPGMKPNPMMEQRIDFINGLELSRAQKTAIQELRQKNMEANKKSIIALKESSDALKKLMLNPGAKQSEVDKQIDARSKAMADLLKSKAHTRNIIYTQILNKEQQKQVMDMLKQKMAEGKVRLGGPRGLMHHEPNHESMQVPAPAPVPAPSPA